MEKIALSLVLVLFPHTKTNQNKFREGIPIMRYESPKYEMEKVNASDVITVSNVIIDDNNADNWLTQVSEALDKAATK